MLDGVEVLEVDGVDLDDFANAHSIDSFDDASAHLLAVRQELFEIRELLAFN